MVNRVNFPDFDSVMQLYVTSKHGQKSVDTFQQGRNLSAISGQGGARQGRGRTGHDGRGRGDPRARQRGLVSQADINKITTIENKHYPNKVYAKFSPAEKAEHWQLRNPGKERGAGPTGGKKTNKNVANVSKFAAAVSSAMSAISALTDVTTKRAAAKEGTEDDPDPWVNPNHDNPALACQSKKSKGNN
jgi:hypothetical protein